MTTPRRRSTRPAGAPPRAESGDSNVAVTTVAGNARRALQASRRPAPPADAVVPTTAALDAAAPIETEPVDAPPAEAEPVDAPPAEADSVEAESVEVEPVEAEPLAADPTASARRRIRSRPRRPAIAEPAAPARRRAPVTLILSLLTVLALVFAVITGVLWYQAAHSAKGRIARARDAVALAARLDVTAVNTSDYHNPQAALQNWLSVSTGSLHDQFAQAQAQAIPLLAQAKMVITATVLDAAVTDLDVKGGTATVIVSLNVKKQPLGKSAVVARNRFKATMALAGGQWKLSDVGEVEVQPL